MPLSETDIFTNTQHAGVQTAGPNKVLQSAVSAVARSAARSTSGNGLAGGDLEDHCGCGVYHCSGSDQYHAKMMDAQFSRLAASTELPHDACQFTHFSPRGDLLATTGAVSTRVWKVSKRD
jgi:hypothetical protein